MTGNDMRKKISWTPLLILSPILLLAEIIRYLFYWTALSILAIGISTVKVIFVVSLDRLLVRYMRFRNVWLVELLIIILWLVIVYNDGWNYV